VFSRTIQSYLGGNNSVREYGANARSLTASVARVQLFGRVQTGYVLLLWDMPSAPGRET
jgi:hypothetical protein